MRRSTLVLVLVLASAASCRQQNPEEESVSGPRPPPAAVVAPTDASVSIDEQLQLLEAELRAAVGEELRDDAVARLVRAEAITDRLLQAQTRVEWLPGDYSLEARLRQLQARADRIIAEARRGILREDLLEEVELLLRDVASLRERLRQPGGGPAPTPLDSLLAGYQRQLEAGPQPAGPVAEEEEDEGPALLGRPVQQDTGQ